MNTVLEELTSLLTGRFEVPEQWAVPDRTFGQLGLDSLATEEFQMVVEEEYGVRIWEDGQVDMDQTVGEMAEKLAAERKPS